MDININLKSIKNVFCDKKSMLTFYKVWKAWPIFWKQQGTGMCVYAVKLETCMQGKQYTSTSSYYLSLGKGKVNRIGEQ